MSEYDELTDCPICPMVATDRDDALRNEQLMYLEQQRWQKMAEELWEELQEWHFPDCVDVDGNGTSDVCVCHGILAAKWDELTNAADYADDGFDDATGAPAPMATREPSVRPVANGGIIVNPGINYVNSPGVSE